MSRLQLKRWALGMSEGLSRGFGGTALGLAVQAHLPAQAPAVQPASPLPGTSHASRAVSLTGVQA